MSIREKVAEAIYEAVRPHWEAKDGIESDPWGKAMEGDDPNREMWRELSDAAITAFLEAAAEQGWHMRQDLTGTGNAAAVDFEWDK